MPDSGRYLYVVSRGLTHGVLDEVTGLDGAPVRVVSHRGLDAVVSDVDLATYGEAGLRRNLEDLQWLERTARSHDRVVHAVASRGPAAPMRLATIFLTDEGVVDRLESWHAALSEVLERVEGRSEWSVKVVVPEATDREPDPASDPATPGAGAAYLQRKRERAQLRASAQEQSLVVADRVYGTLSAGAVAGRRLQPQDPRLSGHRGTMILNAAFLVEDDRRADFERLLAEQKAGLPEGALHHGGPWPPYSFAVLDAP